MTGRVEKNGEGEILGEKKGQGSKVQHFLNWCRMGCDGITGRQKERDRLRSTMTLICRQRLLKERRRKKKKVLWVLLFITNHKRPRLCCQWL